MPPDQRPSIIFELSAFAPKNGGVMLNYIRVPRDFGTPASELLAEALKFAGCPRPDFIESTAILNPRLSRLLTPDPAANLTPSQIQANFELAQRIAQLEAAAFARAAGGRVLNGGLVRNDLGNWIARFRFAY